MLEVNKSHLLLHLKGGFALRNILVVVVGYMAMFAVASLFLLIIILGALSVIVGSKLKKRCDIVFLL